MLFFESEDTEVSKADRNKLFASNEKEIDNHTLMFDMLHANMSILCSCCSLLIFVAKTPPKALNFNFYVHKAPSVVGE